MNSEILHLLLVSLCFICYYLVSGENGRDSMATLSLGPCCVLLGKLLPDDDRMASAALVDNALDLVHIVSMRLMRFNLINKEYKDIPSRQC